MIQDQNKIRKKGVSYLLPGHNIVNSDIWVMDETYFNKDIVLMLVIALKTTTILGACIRVNTQEEAITIAFIEAIEIQQLFQKLIDDGNNTPKIIHFDQKKEYQESKLLQFLNEKQIKISIAGKHENQVAESINHQIKAQVIDVIFEKYHQDKQFAVFKSICPQKIKKLSLSQKRVNREFRDFLFHSDFFRNKVNITEVVEEAIQKFNAKKSQVSETPFDRKTLNQLNNLIEPPTQIVQAKKGSVDAMVIQTINDSSYKEAASKITQILEKETDPQQAICEINDLFITTEEFKPQAQHEMMKAFVFIASQNQYQINQTKELSQTISQLVNRNNELLNLVTELTEQKRRDEIIAQKKEEARLKRQNRKLRPKTQPFTLEMYETLIQTIKGKGFLKARLRSAFTLLAITGLRFRELNLLKMKQVQNLFIDHFCPINRKKRGAANLKAFLRESGVQMLKQRSDDFQTLLLSKFQRLEDEAMVWDSYVFSSEKDPNKPLTRTFFNEMLNQALKSVVPESSQHAFSTHSFRHNFITELWKDTGDIEFVRQFMGHASIQSTQAYIQEITDAHKIKTILEADIKKKIKLLQKEKEKERPKA